MNVFILSALLFGVVWAELSCECGKRNTGRIYGGKETKKNEYPWMAALQKKRGNITLCGGSIITQKHVLTAAHCTYALKAKDLALIVGGYDLTKLEDREKQYLMIDKIIEHYDYDYEYDLNDIAIIVPSKTIEYGPTIGPVCMPSKMTGDGLTGQMVKAMGWGLYGPVARWDRVTKLREIDLQIVSEHERCVNPGGTRLCTFAMGKDTCVGDSGGPVIWLDPETNRFTLVGVVSFGYAEDCGDTSFPALNTNVSAYIDWIDRKLKPLVTEEIKTCHKIE